MQIKVVVQSHTVALLAIQSFTSVSLPLSPPFPLPHLSSLLFLTCILTFLFSFLTLESFHSISNSWLLFHFCLHMCQQEYIFRMGRYKKPLLFCFWEQMVITEELIGRIKTFKEFQIFDFLLCKRSLFTSALSSCHNLR